MTTVKMKGQCQVGGCNHPARYALYKTYPDGEKRWLHVCLKHEAEIGQENMVRAGGYLSTRKCAAIKARMEV